MNFHSPLVSGRLVQRYKRFLADVELEDGSVITAHVPNPGAMLGLCDPGLTVWLSPAPAGSARKLAWTLEIVDAVHPVTGVCVAAGVNTMHPNRLVAEALAAGDLLEFAGYDRVRPEVRYGMASRVDFLLEAEGRPPCYLEVKNVHLSRTAGLAEFPDCVAARSAKHLKELSDMVAAGARAAVLFVVQREDCDAFSACRDIDAKFAAALDTAVDAGLEVVVRACLVRPDGIRLDRQITWRR